MSGLVTMFAAAKMAADCGQAYGDLRASIRDLSQTLHASSVESRFQHYDWMAERVSSGEDAPDWRPALPGFDRLQSFKNGYDLLALDGQCITRQADLGVDLLTEHGWLADVYARRVVPRGGTVGIEAGLKPSVYRFETRQDAMNEIRANHPFVRDEKGLGQTRLIVSEAGADATVGEPVRLDFTPETVRAVFGLLPTLVNAGCGVEFSTNPLKAFAVIHPSERLPGPVVEGLLNVAARGARD